MRRLRGWACAFVAAWTIVSCGEVFALNTSSHRIINVQAVERSALEAVLKEDLALTAGTNQVFGTRTVRAWIGEGGVTEDDERRFFRHFHDPLRPWDSAGLQLVPGAPRFASSIRWMQSSSQGWSWQRARDFFKTALTAPTKAERDEAFAHAIRAVGQVMHLVVDASVPEHVRNDPHPGGPVFGNYEYWVSFQHEQPGEGAESVFITQFLSDPVQVDPIIFGQPTNDAGAPVPVARLIDSDTYRGAETGADVTLDRPVGIAEFAHANFFSENRGALPGEPAPYPYPDPGRLVPSTFSAPRTGLVRAYYRKVGGDGHGRTVDPALTECVLDELARREGIPTALTYACVDEQVWTATAREMLPRAVGYARAALDYFFRGRLGVAFGPDPDDLDRLALLLTNASSEPLGPGSVTVYADDAQGTRRVLASAPNILVSPAAPGAELPPISIPSENLGDRLTILYEGALGGEATAVIGKVVLPITAVEQIFRGATDWMLRTAEGIFPLGLGLGSSPEAVKWGERDNTFFIQRYEPANNWDLDIRSYRINRPEGASTVPLTAEATVDIIETGSARLSGPAIDLDTRVTFSRLERLTQQQVVLIGRQRSQSPEEYNYSLDDVFSFDLGEYVPPPEVPSSASIAFEFPHMTNGLANWYGERISLNRDGDILATLQVGLGHSWGGTPVGCRHYGRDFQDFDCSFRAWHDLPRPRSLAYVVNLTDRTLVAKSTGSSVGISYTTDSDRWNVDVRLFNFEGEETGLNRALVGFGDPGAPVVAEATIAEQITELTMSGLHDPAFVGAGFSEHAFVSGAFTRDVPVDTRFYNDFSIRLTTQRRYLCPNFTVIEGIEAARGSGGQYMALGQMDCYDDAPVRFRPVLWDPAAGAATAFTALDVPRVGYDSAVWPTLLGANRAAALFTVDSFESASVTYLVTQARAIPLPAGVEAEDLRLLEAGVILNVRTFQIVHPDEHLTPIRSLPPPADGGPVAGEYHLVGVQ